MNCQQTAVAFASSCCCFLLLIILMLFILFYFFFLGFFVSAISLKPQRANKLVFSQHKHCIVFVLTLVALLRLFTFSHFVLCFMLRCILLYCEHCNFVIIYFRICVGERWPQQPTHIYTHNQAQFNLQQSRFLIENKKSTLLEFKSTQGRTQTPNLENFCFYM